MALQRAPMNGLHISGRVRVKSTLLDREPCSSLSSGRQVDTLVAPASRPLEWQPNHFMGGPVLGES